MSKRGHDELEEIGGGEKVEEKRTAHVEEESDDDDVGPMPEAPSEAPKKRRGTMRAMARRTR